MSQRVGTQVTLLQDAWGLTLMQRARMQMIVAC